MRSRGRGVARSASECLARKLSQKLVSASSLCLLACGARSSLRLSGTDVMYSYVAPKTTSTLILKDAGARTGSRASRRRRRAGGDFSPGRCGAGGGAKIAATTFAALQWPRRAVQSTTCFPEGTEKSIGWAKGSQKQWFRFWLIVVTERIMYLVSSGQGRHVLLLDDDAAPASVLPRTQAQASLFFLPSLASTLSSPSWKAAVFLCFLPRLAHCLSLPAAGPVSPFPTFSVHFHAFIPRRYRSPC